MPVYEPNLPARQVHDRFSRTLHEAEAVRRNLVLWFADLYRRKLYLELGYTSIFAYTAERHGFSKSRCVQFIRLAESLKRLPALHESLAAGEMPWTKAREVVKVATPETERAWVDEAKRSSRRALERKIAAARGRVKESRGPMRGQESLALAATEAVGRDRGSADENGAARALPSGAGTPAVEGAGETADGKRPNTGGRGETGEGRRAALVHEIPEEVRLRFPALRYAEYGALVEKLRKQGWKGPVEDLIVAGLAALAGEGRTPGAGVKTSAVSESNVKASSVGAGTEGSAVPRPGSNAPWVGARPADENRPAAVAGVEDPPARCTRVFASTPYQVVIRRCEDCGRGEVLTGRGPKPLHPAELAAILCDARVHRRGAKNRAVIPPALRRRVLERDGHRCRVAGCGSGRFLSVHHRKPRSAGGTNTPGNLVTLCASCHRAIHEMGERTGRELLGRMLRAPAPVIPEGTQTASGPE